MMKLLRMVKLNFYHWLSDWKYAVVFVYLLLYTHGRLHGLVDYSAELEHNIAPWVFPFLTTGGYTFLPLMLAYVLLISDAPFRTRQQQFVILRTGKRAWLAGQLLYLLAVSVGYTLLLWILSLIWILPAIEWDSGWGPVLITASKTGGYVVHGVVMDINYALMKNSDPLEVALWCAGAMTAVCFFLGVLMTVCNLWCKKGVGTVVVSTLVTIGLIPSLFNSNPSPLLKLLNWISPITWMDRRLMGYSEQYLPSYSYGIWMPALLGLIGSALLLMTIGKCSVETEKE